MFTDMMPRVMSVYQALYIKMCNVCMMFNKIGILPTGGNELPKNPSLIYKE